MHDATNRNRVADFVLWCVFITLSAMTASGICRQAVMALVERAHREIDQGLLPSVQLALAYRGELVEFITLGNAKNDQRYVVFSATKAFVAGAIWSLIGDGLIDVALPVSHYLPEFATNGKDAVTVEQVMLHTSGFPLAPMRADVGATSQGRNETFARWRLTYEPGSKYHYHASSAHWVLAEIIEQVTGCDFRDVVAQRVTEPAGLERVLGGVSHGAAQLQVVGSPASAEEMMSTFGVSSLDVGEVTDDALLAFNDPAVQAVGVPGGGGVMRACDLAMFYQAVLHNPNEMWSPPVLRDATTNVRNSLPDVMTGVAANRTLGLIQAGSDGKSNYRGMGRCVSPHAIGHNGAKGQIAWGDPVSGLSFGYCTNGLDANVVREPRRTTAIASLAAACVFE